MIEADKRQAVFLLHQEGMSVREIARRLQLSRNTVRTILQQQGEMPARIRKDKIRLEAELLQRLYRECEGWAQRVHEKLVEEEGVQVAYSTLTRRLRELGLSQCIGAEGDGYVSLPCRRSAALSGRNLAYHLARYLDRWLRPNRRRGYSGGASDHSTHLHTHLGQCHLRILLR
jgi:transposase